MPMTHHLYSTGFSIKVYGSCDGSCTLPKRSLQVALERVLCQCLNWINYYTLTLWMYYEENTEDDDTPKTSTVNCQEIASSTELNLYNNGRGEMNNETGCFVHEFSNVNYFSPYESTVQLFYRKISKTQAFFARPWNKIKELNSVIDELIDKIFSENSHQKMSVSFKILIWTKKANIYVFSLNI